MQANEIVSLTRDCPAVLIPAGAPITLPAGQQVTITQSLGGSYTCYVEGNLVRVDGQDADALGKTPMQHGFDISETTADGAVDEQQIWQQLATCYDPEIPINIVELGLIYDCAVTPLSEGGNRVDIKMTLTAPGCGMGAILQQDVANKIKSVPNVTDANVEIVFDPPWDQSRMSEAAKLQAGLL
ncbi:MAG: putative Fe-S cluster assembly protein SufT [Gammaproteobacteria bacterium]|jgi:probable FeS assembly SUF system protein SufT